MWTREVAEREKKGGREKKKKKGKKEEEREKLKGRARKPSGDAECEKLYGTNDPRLTTQLCRSGEKVGT